MWPTFVDISEPEKNGLFGPNLDSYDLLRSGLSTIYYKVYTCKILGLPFSTILAESISLGVTWGIQYIEVRLKKAKSLLIVSPIFWRIRPLCGSCFRL